MEADFWHKKWEAREIGFHQPKENAFLVQFLERLSIPQGGTVFVPLCGKSLDIHWLLKQGYNVVGAELSGQATDELFAELELNPEIKNHEQYTEYKSKNIRIFVGDIFTLTAEALGPVDGIYDRAALVALPENMRRDYAQHLTSLTQNAPQLVITFEYNQAQLPGPPFSISPAHLGELYGQTYTLEDTANRAIKQGLHNIAATERAWVLQPL